MGMVWWVWVFWGLTTAVAVTDWRGHIIPNELFLVGLANGAAGIAIGHAWWHIAWAVGGWIVFEGWMALFPGQLGWGDVKWSAVALITLGSTGLAVVLCGLVGTYLWGWGRWLWRRWHQIREPRRGHPLPWAPAAWGGLTLILTTFLLAR